MNRSAHAPWCGDPRTPRARLLMGVTRAVARRAYLDVKVNDILIEVRETRPTFFKHFVDKDECYLEGYKAAHKAVLEAVDGAACAHEDSVQRLIAGYRAFVEFLAAEPELSQAYLLSIRSAGPQAATLRARAHDDFAVRLQRLHTVLCEQTGGLQHVPYEIMLALVSGTDRIVTLELEQGRCAELPGALPQLLYLNLSVWGLQSAAARALEGGDAGL